MMTRRSLMSALALLLPASLRPKVKAASPVAKPKKPRWQTTWTHPGPDGSYTFNLGTRSLEWERK